MTHPITLLLGVHAHQPVGNFPEVIEDAHQRCYKPFLETLHAYPDFRFAAHFSGWLLDWLRERHPADMELLATMVKRGQVELFSSGDTEPVLAAIPHRDRVGQLRTLNDKLAAWTGVRPSGAWLTERVWESAVVPALAETGIRYVTVDDYHFFCTGKAAAELDGFFSTEESGTRLDLFPISEALRYRLPFSPAPDVIGYLENLAEQGQAAAIYFDDIEKFGIWPETYDWVYNRGWLKALIEGVLASPLIRTATYADFHARAATRGIVYLPTTSYSEMNEWTLPMPAAGIYSNLLASEKAAGRAEQHRPFLRGGIWRNFLTRYPEANWMHKRMQALSARLHELAPPPPALTADLYRAQANDAYWHGLFGGLYLPHLRRAVWQNIVALEAGLDALAPRPPIEVRDLDLDGHDEIFALSRELQLVVRADGLAAPMNWSATGSATISATPCAATTSTITTGSATARARMPVTASPRPTTSSAASSRSPPRTSFPTSCHAPCGSTSSTASASPTTAALPPLPNCVSTAPGCTRPWPLTARGSSFPGNSTGWPGSASRPASIWRCPVAMVFSAATCWPTAALPAASASRWHCPPPLGWCSKMAYWAAGSNCKPRCRRK